MKFFIVLWTVCTSPWLRRCQCRKFWHDASDIHRRHGSGSRSGHDANQLWRNGSLFYRIQVWFSSVFAQLWFFLGTIINCVKVVMPCCSLVFRINNKFKPIFIESQTIVVLILTICGVSDLNNFTLFLMVISVMN